MVRVFISYTTIEVEFCSIFTQAEHADLVAYVFTFS